jgi:hypothetical protein
VPLGYTQRGVSQCIDWGRLQGVSLALQLLGVWGTEGTWGSEDKGPGRRETEGGVGGGCGRQMCACDWWWGGGEQRTAAVQHAPHKLGHVLTRVGTVECLYSVHHDLGICSGRSRQGVVPALPTQCSGGATQGAGQMLAAQATDVATTMCQCRGRLSVTECTYV